MPLLTLCFALVFLGTSNSQPDADPQGKMEMRQQATSSVDSLWQIYCNENYHYCIEYPARFLAMQPESDLGDGCIFLDNSGNEVLRIFGRNNSDPDLGKINTLKEQLKADTLSFLKEKPGAKIVYHKVADRFSVYSGVWKGKIYYRKTVIAGKDLAFAYFQYPEADKAQYDGMLTRMAASFH